MINENNGQFSISIEDGDINLVKVRPGNFEMGSKSGLPLELPVHNVAINKSFFISSYLVTQKLWLSLMNLNPSFNDANEDNPVENISWYDLNAMRKTQPIGLKLPNHWGLYDIVGNVWEWCDDNWVDSYEHKLVDNLENLSNSQNNNIRKVIRGGSYDLDDYRCRSAYRSFEHATFPSTKIGFRFVIEIKTPK